MFSFKNIILTLIGIGLLWSFQTSATSDFHHEKSAIVDAMQDEESPKKETCELENWKFLNHATIDFKALKLSLRIPRNTDNIILTDFSSLPDSPPDAQA